MPSKDSRTKRVQKEITCDYLPLQMIFKIGRMSKISNTAFCFPHKEVNQKLVCSFFSISFPYLLPTNNAGPASGCHQWCTQHKFSQYFRHKLTQPTSAFSFSCHPDLLYFPIPNLADSHLLAAHVGVLNKLQLSGLAWPMDTHGTRVLLPGIGTSACVFP